MTGEGNLLGLIAEIEAIEDGFFVNSCPPGRKKAAFSPCGQAPMRGQKETPAFREEGGRSSSYLSVTKC